MITDIKSDRPFALGHLGEWGAIVGRVFLPAGEHLPSLECFIVAFPNGDRDWWPVDNKAADYAFRVRMADGWVVHVAEPVLI